MTPPNEFVLRAFWRTIGVRVRSVSAVFGWFGIVLRAAISTVRGRLLRARWLGLLGPTATHSELGHPLVLLLVLRHRSLLQVKDLVYRFVVVIEEDRLFADIYWASPVQVLVLTHFVAIR